MLASRFLSPSLFPEVCTQEVALDCLLGEELDFFGVAPSQCGSWAFLGIPGHSWAFLGITGHYWAGPVFSMLNNAGEEAEAGAAGRHSKLRTVAEVRRKVRPASPRPPVALDCVAAEEEEEVRHLPIPNE